MGLSSEYGGEGDDRELAQHHVQKSFGVNLETFEERVTEGAEWIYSDNSGEMMMQMTHSAPEGHPIHDPE